MENRRSHIRFKPYSGSEIANVDTKNEEVKDFKPDTFGLVYEEAYKGCGAIFIGEGVFPDGAICLIKVGEIGPQKAEVRYSKTIEGEFQKVGFLYVDV